MGLRQKKALCTCSIPKSTLLRHFYSRHIRVFSHWLARLKGHLESKLNVAKLWAQQQSEESEQCAMLKESPPQGWKSTLSSQYAIMECSSQCPADRLSSESILRNSARPCIAVPGDQLQIWPVCRPQGQHQKPHVFAAGRNKAQPPAQKWPRTILVWGNSANRDTSVPPKAKLVIVLYHHQGLGTIGPFTFSWEKF